MKTNQIKSLVESSSEVEAIVEAVKNWPPKGAKTNMKGIKAGDTLAVDWDGPSTVHLVRISNDAYYLEDFTKPRGEQNLVVSKSELKGMMYDNLK
ncbi:hypothetical protein Molly5_184 [Maribacter phage Molly_5]|uniref:Uncharacterized protein n=1 Tax=Maribacter phage Molly_1 TaxID=2745685 RepID=A0A8E4XY43_9CAUD|nr:hypothetical protein M1M29_gp184 [Maribacter phage Molly_1]QQO97682.1 hypothetical protein Molly2_184 [Maribacter phage Molly_2]QQO97882.1 hypothetical protein Molly3_184 [Maribacter phage Molly_3]QQO98082.1 hypothetical protein Molly4_184 [Maribacter phage Molly_4]QQO98282.1 hypothetical protein Molly5_184 [Maribacter phage Molly_5]QQO97482.1 hypothetical protein Molly1_184 [Maribacter phage Molly_1]